MLDAPVAAAMLAGVEAFDPRGIHTARDLLPMARAGQCFSITTANAQAVYVLNVHHGQAWVQAAKGQGSDDLVGLLLPAIEHQARGLQSVAFQTARPGLVRKAQRHGYKVTGWIMKKELPHG